MFFSSVWKQAALSALLMGQGAVSKPVELHHVLKEEKRSAPVHAANASSAFRFLGTKTKREYLKKCLLSRTDRSQHSK
jgi:hypothetical protein